MNEEAPKQGFLKRIELTGQLSRLIVYLSAAIPAVICLLLALLSYLPGFISPIYVFNPIAKRQMPIGTPFDFVLIAIILCTGTYGIYEAIRYRKIREIDKRFPDFVRDLAESRRAGMTFTKAIMYSAKGNYGLLTVEIQKIARQISWGSSVDSALAAFAKRVNTKLIKRTINLIIEASRSGGNVADVLDAASHDARELKFIDAERRAGMMSYVAVVYVGMGVFLMIIVILCISLIPAMLGEGSASLAQASGGSGGLGQKMVTDLFFVAAIIQSIGMGVVAGVFEEGNFNTGIKHIFIMVLITWLAFKVGIGA